MRLDIRAAMTGCLADWQIPAVAAAVGWPAKLAWAPAGIPLTTMVNPNNVTRLSTVTSLPAPAIRPPPIAAPFRLLGT
jgi:hypothetical protein